MPRTKNRNTVERSGDFIRGYHDRTWIDGPPRWWIEMHAEAFRRTVFKESHAPRRSDR